MSASSFAIANEDYQLTPFRTIHGIAPVIESSYRWSPQIQPAYSVGRVVHRPQQLIAPPAVTSNNLPVGGIGTQPRVTVRGSFPGIIATGWVPPDPNIGVGPNHIVEVVNSDIAWFTKAGVRQFQVSMGPIPGTPEGFFETVGATDFVFDPKVFYDSVNQRFFVLALEVEDSQQISKILVAVSDDNDPNGNWAKYRLEAKATINGNVAWLDYPGFGSNKDAICVTGNMFGFTSGFQGAQFIVIPKAPLLTGSPATQVSIIDTNTGSVQVARSPDALDTRLFCVANGSSNSQMRLFALTGLPNAPVLNATNVPIPSWTFPFNNAPSPGGRTLDTLDGRIFEVDYRAGRVVACHTVQAAPGNPRTACRWYDVQTNNWPTSGTPSLVQSGQVASGSANEFYHMPGIGVNAVGDIALVFTRSSQTIVADIMVCGRKAADPLGTMSPPVLIKSAEGSAYGSPGFNRWGDYFSMEVDPVDGVTFWSVGMTGMANGNWTTAINKHTISEILPGVGTNFPPDSIGIYSDIQSIPPTQGQNLTGSAASVANSDNVYATIDAVNATGLGQIAAAELYFSTSRPPAAFNSMTVRVEAISSASNTGMVWAYDLTKNKYVQLRSFVLKTSGNAFVDVALPKPYSKWVTPAGVVRVVVRGLSPLRRGSNILPLPFTFSIDQVELRTRLQN